MRQEPTAPVGHASRPFNQISRQPASRVRFPNGRTLDAVTDPARPAIQLAFISALLAIQTMPSAKLPPLSRRRRPISGGPASAATEVPE
jgi:hypothetical protein